MTNPNTSNAFLACRGPLTDTPPNSYSDHHPLCSARRGTLMEKCSEHWKSLITSSDGWGIWNPERSASCLNTHGWSGVTQRPERTSWVSYLSAVKRMSQRKAEGNKLFSMKLNGSSGIGIRKCMLEPFSVTWSSVALSTSAPLMVLGPAALGEDVDDLNTSRILVLCVAPVCVWLPPWWLKMITLVLTWIIKPILTWLACGWQCVGTSALFVCWSSLNH